MKHPLLAVLVLFVIIKGPCAAGELLPVVPQPKSWTPARGAWTVPARLGVDAGGTTAGATLVADWSAAFGPSRVGGNGSDVVCRLEATGGFAPEGYRLVIAPTGVTLTAGTERGLFWGTRTFLQLARHAGKLRCGTIDDAPKYRLRGFMLDVGRKPYSMAFLRLLAKDLAYYKMNCFHIHLNDDGARIFTKPGKPVHGFRLESETYPGLASEDCHYTKQEFRAFVKACAAMGITVIPEIDSPAHAASFEDYFRKAGRKDHFNIVGNFTNTVAFIEKLYDEYLSGPDPVFAGPYVHIGMDEFGEKYADAFRAYGDELRRIVRKYGKKVCIWGAAEHPAKPDGEILCDIWSAGGTGTNSYDPLKMMANGYDTVCLQGGRLYIVPAAGYYNDYLRVKDLFNDWEPCIFGAKSKTTPDEKHLFGGKFAVWNDLSENGISEDDTFDRVMPALGTIAEKTWAGTRADLDWQTYSEIFAGLGEAPGVNLADRLTGPNGTRGEGDTTVGWSQGGGYTVAFEIKPRQARAEIETLFDDGFSRVTLTADGRLGFFRDGLGHAFAAKIAADRWTRVAFEGDPDGENLILDGDFKESTKGLSYFCTNWCNRGYSLYLRSPRTLHFPLVEKPFSGEIRNVRVTTGHETKVLRLNADDYRKADGFADVAKMADLVNASGADAVVITNARCDGPTEGGNQPKKGEATVVAFRCCFANTYGSKTTLSSAKGADGVMRETAVLVRDHRQGNIRVPTVPEGTPPLPFRR